MLEKLWESFKGGKDMVSQAKSESLAMLATGKEMFRLVVTSVEEENTQLLRQKVGAKDKSINEQQTEVRKKLYTHIAVSQQRDVLEALQLMIIVVDLERIGDYIKNIAEIAEMLPEALHFHDYDEIYRSLVERTIAMFDLTRDAFRDGDEAKAEQACQLYSEIGRTCERTIKELITHDEGEPDAVPRWQVGLGLLLRYVKRINAHLKNISTAVINPFHRIGFRPGL